MTTTNTCLKTLKHVRKFAILYYDDVQYVNQYNYLGLVLDNEMTYSPPFKNINKRVSNAIFALIKLRKYLTNVEWPGQVAANSDRLYGCAPA